MKKPRLDEKFKVAAVVVAADGGIGTRDILSVNCGRDIDMLSNGETKDILVVGELEAVTGERLS